MSHTECMTKVLSQAQIDIIKVECLRGNQSHRVKFIPTFYLFLFTDNALKFNPSLLYAPLQRLQYRSESLSETICAYYALLITLINLSLG